MQWAVIKFPSRVLLFEINVFDKHQLTPEKIYYVHETGIAFNRNNVPRILALKVRR